MTTKRRALGRGLAALIPAAANVGSGAGRGSGRARRRRRERGGRGPPDGRRPQAPRWRARARAAPS